MKAMNKVASHINEMQKIHEEYGAVFDQLINEQTANKKEVNLPFDANHPSVIQWFMFNWMFILSFVSQVADLSMGDLLLHSSVVWINPPAALVKGKKDPDLAAFGEDPCGDWFPFVHTFLW